MQKRQQTEDQTYINLGSYRLGAWMETHQHAPTSSEFITYNGNTRWRGISQGKGSDIVILRNRRNL
jgi:hypothetical protein